MKNLLLNIEKITNKFFFILKKLSVTDFIFFIKFSF